jgi:AraC-like DNA-binding protein
MNAIISATQSYTLRVFEADCPALIIPLQGRKVIAWDQSSLAIGAGDYLMLHRPLKGSVQNVVEGGVYRARCIAFPWRVVDLARTLLDAHSLPPAPGPAVVTGPLVRLEDSLRALPDTDAATPDAAVHDHALLGILLALARHGDAQFRRAYDPTLAARIRMLVGADPGRDWTSGDLEAQLHMSGPTLRRRLAAEGTSLRALVRDARLDHGLALLQSTSRPLKAIAAACGYRSAPSFGRQFAERFGVEPGTVAAGRE